MGLLKHKTIPSHLWTLKFYFDEIGPHFWNFHSFLIIFILSSFVICIHFDVYAPPCSWSQRKTQLYNYSSKMSFSLVGKSFRELFILLKNFEMSGILLRLLWIMIRFLHPILLALKAGKAIFLCQLWKHKHHWIHLSFTLRLWELRKQCIYFCHQIFYKIWISRTVSAVSQVGAAGVCGPPRLVSR